MTAPVALAVMHKKGISLLSENEGTGSVANQGDIIDFDLEINLNKGDNVSKDNYVRKLNRANMIPGIVYSIIGMKEGGYREVKISPHLAHKEKGVLGVIPENADVAIKRAAPQFNR